MTGAAPGPGAPVEPPADLADAMARAAGDLMALGDVCRDILRRFRSLVRSGQTPAESWRPHVYEALHRLGGQSDRSGASLRNYVHRRYGPFFVAGAEAFVEPHADSGPDPMSHPGEELVVILEGGMHFVVGDQPFDLAEGDSLHFRTTLPHSWANPSDKPARAIWLAIRSS